MTGVDGSVPEQRLDHVGRGVVVEVLGREHATAVVGSQAQQAAVGFAGARRFRQARQPVSDRGSADGRGVAHGLQQIGRPRSALVLVVVSVVTGGDRGRAVAYRAACPPGTG